MLGSTARGPTGTALQASHGASPRTSAGGIPRLLPHTGIPALLMRTSKSSLRLASAEVSARSTTHAVPANLRCRGLQLRFVAVRDRYGRSSQTEAPSTCKSDTACAAGYKCSPPAQVDLSQVATHVIQDVALHPNIIARWRASATVPRHDCRSTSMPATLPPCIEGRFEGSHRLPSGGKRVHVIARSRHSSSSDHSPRAYVRTAFKAISWRGQHKRRQP